MIQKLCLICRRERDGIDVIDNKSIRKLRKILEAQEETLADKGPYHVCRLCVRKIQRNEGPSQSLSQSLEATPAFTPVSEDILSSSQSQQIESQSQFSQPLPQQSGVSPQRSSITTRSQLGRSSGLENTSSIVNVNNVSASNNEPSTSGVERNPVSAPRFTALNSKQLMDQSPKTPSQPLLVSPTTNISEVQNRTSRSPSTAKKRKAETEAVPKQNDKFGGLLEKQVAGSQGAKKRRNVGFTEPPVLSPPSTDRSNSSGAMPPPQSQESGGRQPSVPNSPPKSNRQPNMATGHSNSAAPYRPRTVNPNPINMRQFDPRAPIAGRLPGG